MMDQRVQTERLDLAPLTLDEVDALLAGDGTPAPRTHRSPLPSSGRAARPT